MPVKVSGDPTRVPDLVNRPRQLVFLTPIDSRLKDLLNEIRLIALCEPSIVVRIVEDLDRRAEKKKLLRLAVPSRSDPRSAQTAASSASSKSMTSNWRKAGPRTDGYIEELYSMVPTWKPVP